MRPRGQNFAVWGSDKDRTKKRAGGAKKHKVGGGFSSRFQSGKFLLRVTTYHQKCLFDQRKVEVWEI